MTLQDLSIEHDYYCNNDPNHDGQKWNYKNWELFYNDYKNADLDYNLLFRWDVRRINSIDRDINIYCMDLYFIQQRKGIFNPISIDIVEDENIEEIIIFLKKAKEKLNSIWSPIK